MIPPPPSAASTSTLLLTCGLPGSGKTTLARRLAAERDAQRFTKDEWVRDLGGDLWDEELRVRVEAKLIELAFELLAAGRSCILDFGLWSRNERDALRLRARRLGVRVELHFVDVPLDELVRRTRSATPTRPGPSPRSAPSSAEQRLFDAPPAAGPPELDRDALLTRFAWVNGHADVWRWFDDPATLRAIAGALVEPFRDRVTKVAGIESRGFILGAACALELDVGFVPIRKGDGVFPGPKAVVQTSADYRGGPQSLRLQRAALTAGDRVLLVDDWIETGSQAAGARTLVEEGCGATFLGVAAIVDQLPPERRHSLVHVHTLVAKALLGGDR